MRAAPLASTRQAETGPGPVGMTCRRTSLEAADAFFLVDLRFDAVVVVRAGTGVVVVVLVVVAAADAAAPSSPLPLPSRYSAPTSSSEDHADHGADREPARLALRTQRASPTAAASAATRAAAPIGIRS